MLKRTLTTTLAATLSIAALSAGNGATKAELTYEDLASVPQLGTPGSPPTASSSLSFATVRFVLAPAAGAWPAILTTTIGAKSGLELVARRRRRLPSSAAASIWTVPSERASPAADRQHAGRPAIRDRRRSPAGVVARRALGPVRERAPRQRGPPRRESRWSDLHFMTSIDADEGAAPGRPTAGASPTSSVRRSTSAAGCW